MHPILFALQTQELPQKIKCSVNVKKIFSAVKLIVDDIENFKSSIQDKMTDEEKERLIKSVCI